MRSARVPPLAEWRERLRPRVRVEDGGLPRFYYPARVNPYVLAATSSGTAWRDGVPGVGRCRLG